MYKIITKLYEYKSLLADHFNMIAYKCINA